jgi:hypothetical protein
MKNLLLEDKQAINEIKREIEAYCNQTNKVLESFESYQDWQPVSAVNCEKILNNPIGAYDEILLTASGVKTAKNPEVVADLMNIDRAGYINSLKMAGYSRLDRSVKFFSINTNYQNLLVFDKEVNRYSVDESKQDEFLNQYRIYIQSKEDQKLYDDYFKLLDLLNDFSRKFKFVENLHGSHIKAKISYEKDKQVFAPDNEFIALAIKKNRVS